MNNYKLEEALSVLLARTNIPYHVIAANHHVSLKRYPTAIIQNTEEHYVPNDGKHWIAWFVTSPTTCEFFDSYGNSLSHYDKLQPPVKKIVKQNCKSLQSYDSYVCGQYCLMFLYFRAMGKSYEKFLDNFVNNRFYNDYVVTKFYKNKIMFRNYQYIQSDVEKFGCIYKYMYDK